MKKSTPSLQQRLSGLRRDYSALELDEHSVMRDPIRQFSFWMEQAIESELEDPNAMTLATADASGRPHLRVVLLRGVGKEGFSWFTNYRSRKGLDLLANKQASLNFFWPELQRQVNISGTVKKTKPGVSDDYFSSRPRESQIGAWASDQSRKVRDRATLMDRYEAYRAKFEGRPVPRPAHWGGYILSPRRIEFWQGRASRLHDRVLYEKKAGGRWSVSRLCP